MNVMITRAKSLLLMITDHDTLCKDKNWQHFYEYCAKHEAVLRNGRKMHKRVQWA